MDATIDNAAPMDDSAAAPGAISVSADAVTVDGVPPAVGDSVTFTVEGSVAAVDGTMLTITPTRINGDEIPVPGPRMSDRDKMRNTAMQDDTVY